MGCFNFGKKVSNIYNARGYVDVAYPNDIVIGRDIGYKVSGQYQFGVNNQAHIMSDRTTIYISMDMVDAYLDSKSFTNCSLKNGLDELEFFRIIEQWRVVNKHIVDIFDQVVDIDYGVMIKLDKPISITLYHNNFVFEILPLHNYQGTVQHDGLGNHMFPMFSTESGTKIYDVDIRPPRFIMNNQNVVNQEDVVPGFALTSSTGKCFYVTVYEHSLGNIRLNTEEILPIDPYTEGLISEETRQVFTMSIDDDGAITTVLHDWDSELDVVVQNLYLQRNTANNSSAYSLTVDGDGILHLQIIDIASFTNGVPFTKELDPIPCLVYDKYLHKLSGTFTYNPNIPHYIVLEDSIGHYWLAEINELEHIATARPRFMTNVLPDSLRMYYTLFDKAFRTEDGTIFELKITRAGRLYTKEVLTTSFEIIDFYELLKDNTARFSGNIETYTVGVNNEGRLYTHNYALRINKPDLPDTFFEGIETQTILNETEGKLYNLSFTDRNPDRLVVTQVGGTTRRIVPYMQTTLRGVPITIKIGEYGRAVTFQGHHEQSMIDEYYRNTIWGIDTKFKSELKIGDLLRIGYEDRTVIKILSDRQLIIDSPLQAPITSYVTGPLYKTLPQQTDFETTYIGNNLLTSRYSKDNDEHKRLGLRNNRGLYYSFHPEERMFTIDDPDDNVLKIYYKEKHMVYKLILNGKILSYQDKNNIVPTMGDYIIDHGVVMRDYYGNKVDWEGNKLSPENDGIMANCITLLKHNVKIKKFNNSCKIITHVNPYIYPIASQLGFTEEMYQMLQEYGIVIYSDRMTETAVRINESQQRLWTVAAPQLIGDIISPAVRLRYFGYYSNAFDKEWIAKLRATSMMKSFSDTYTYETLQVPNHQYASMDVVKLSTNGTITYDIIFASDEEEQFGQGFESYVTMINDSSEQRARLIVDTGGVYLVYSNIYYTTGESITLQEDVNKINGTINFVTRDAFFLKDHLIPYVEDLGTVECLNHRLFRIDPEWTYGEQQRQELCCE